VGRVDAEEAVAQVRAGAVAVDEGRVGRAAVVVGAVEER
jgi:hypothetical protein